jgi:hypothetical protein
MTFTPKPHTIRVIKSSSIRRGGARDTYEWEEKYINDFGWEHLKEREDLEDGGVNFGLSSRGDTIYK